MGVSGRAWHTGVGVDNCQPPHPLMGRARTRTRFHWPTWPDEMWESHIKAWQKIKVNFRQV
jgi:hypothetical protein